MQQATGVGLTPPAPATENGEALDSSSSEQGHEVLPPAHRVDDNLYASQQGMPHHHQMMMHAHMNGAMPPHQVYVSSAVPGMPPAGIAGLENQFQSLGFKQEDSSGHGTDQLTNSGPNSETNNLEGMEEIEGEDAEEEPVKLFVGQVSRSNAGGHCRRAAFCVGIAGLCTRCKAVMHGTVAVDSPLRE
jgi:hypothetical protein